MNMRIVGDHHERSKKSAMAGRLLLVLMSGMPRNKHHNHVKNLLMHEIKAASQVKITHNKHQIFPRLAKLRTTCVFEDMIDFIVHLILLSSCFLAIFSDFFLF